MKSSTINEIWFISLPLLHQYVRLRTSEVIWNSTEVQCYFRCCWTASFGHPLQPSSLRATRSKKMMSVTSCLYLECPATWKHLLKMVRITIINVNIILSSITHSASSDQLLFYCSVSSRAKEPREVLDRLGGAGHRDDGGSSRGHTSHSVNMFWETEAAAALHSVQHLSWGPVCLYINLLQWFRLRLKWSTDHFKRVHVLTVYMFIKPLLYLPVRFWLVFVCGTTY